MLCAPTGKAAFNIGGVTMHNAFNFSFNLDKEICENRKLSADVKNTLRCKYQKLKLIVIDEVSMVGSKMLHSMNRVLPDTFDNTEPFGGISIVFGDMNQLQPVKDSWVFENPNTIAGGLLGSYLCSNFVLFPLDEIMRQKDDKIFAVAMSNLAVGRITEEDNAMFRSRELLQKLLMSLTDVMDKSVIAIDYCNSIPFHELSNSVDISERTFCFSKIFQFNARSLNNDTMVATNFGF